MKALWKSAFAVSGLAIATLADAQVTFYEHSGFRGQSFSVDRPMGNLDRRGIGNSASSVVVSGESWELCDGPGFSGRCVVLRPGRYASLGSVGLDDAVSSVRPVSARGGPSHPGPAYPGPGQQAPGPSAAHVTFYEHQGLRGQSFTAERPINRLERAGFNNRASSAVVVGESWEVCSRSNFKGNCVVLRPGRYDSLGSMGLNDSISSARPAHRHHR